MIDVLLYSAIIIVVYATVWFFLSLIVKRNDIADIAWGIGYMLLCTAYFFSFEGSLRAYSIYFLIMIWGTRLSLHIWLRNRGKKEDHRYAQWRKEWGKWFYLRSYIQVYLLQGLLLLCVISPVMIVSVYKQPSLIWLDYIGIMVWMVGFFFESVGDYQLMVFLQQRKNRGKVMQEGLWRFTRHPNYFGEVTMWWGIFLLVVHSPFGLWGIIGPLTITVLILGVSGIPMLERRYANNPEYQKYQNETSSFFPFPKK